MAEPIRSFRPFLLRRVVVEGSSLQTDRLTSAWQALVGRTIDQAALQEIVDQLSATYATSDIALYTILVPEQDAGDGTLRLTVVEGYVAAVEVRGALRAVRRSLLKAYLRKLETERPLRRSTLQRVTSLIRDMPGLVPDLSLIPEAKQGAVRLVIKARDKPIQLGFGISNRGTALLGRTQLQADAYLNALLSGADQLHITGVAPTHASRFQYVAGAYLAPLDADGTTVQGNVGYLRTRPPIFRSADATIRLNGHSLSFGGQISHPFVRSYDRNLTATLGLDGVDSDNALLGLVLSNDRVRTARAALAFTSSSKLNQFSLSGTLSLGLDALGARTVAGEARKGFRKLSLKAGEAHQIGRSFVLRLSGFVQATPDKLPASEQLALGGDEFGRSYEAAIIAGDRGFAGSAELAWHPVTGLPKMLSGSELFGFADGGHVWNRERFGLPGTDSNLASVGGGARLQIAAKSVVQIEADRGLSNPVVYENRERWRALFSLRSQL